MEEDEVLEVIVDEVESVLMELSLRRTGAGEEVERAARLLLLLLLLFEELL